MSSSICSCISRGSTAPVVCSNRSDRVVLPWSMCAMIGKLRINRGSGIRVGGAINTNGGDCHPGDKPEIRNQKPERNVAPAPFWFLVSGFWFASTGLLPLMAAVEADAQVEDDVRDDHHRDHDPGHDGCVQLKDHHGRDAQRDQRDVDQPDGHAATADSLGLASRTGTHPPMISSRAWTSAYTVAWRWSPPHRRDWDAPSRSHSRRKAAKSRFARAPAPISAISPSLAT